MLAVGFVVVLATSEPASERRAKSPLVGKAVPALAGETLDGGTFDIDDQRGRWVVVNFFATWCAPCRLEHPELAGVRRGPPPGGRRRGGQRGVPRHRGQHPRLLRRQRRRVAGPAQRGRPGAGDFGVVKVPETYLVDPDGVVVAKLIGGVTQQGLDDTIAESQARRAATAA